MQETEPASPTATSTRRTGFDLLPRQGSRHLLAVDVSDFMRRAWHGHVNSKRHEPHMAAPTALKKLARILRGRQPTHVLFAGEGLGSVRKQIFAGYKAGRPEKPDGLVLCEAQVEQALAAAGTPLVKFAGLEADDVLCGAAIAAGGQALPVVLATQDKDAMYLVSDARRVVVWRDAEEVFDEAAVVAKWGVPPSCMGELLAIMGDATDGVPGAKGLGLAAAAEILTTTKRPFSVLVADGGYHWLPAKYQKKWLASLERIRMSWELARPRGEGLERRLFLDDCEVSALDVAGLLRDSAEALGQATTAVRGEKAT